MELTPKERLFLVNQYRILEALYPDEAEDFRNRAEAARRGYEAWYGDDWIDPDPTSNAEVRETGDIMTMNTVMQATVNRLGDECEIDLQDVRFPGFSGNDEGHFGYATYLVDHLGRFSHLELGDDGLNSHFPMLDQYRPQLEVWYRIREDRQPREFTEADVRAILDAPK